MDEPELEISFSDSTLIEAEGKFDQVKSLMENDSLGNTEWMLRTHCTLVTAGGISEMVLHFYSDGRVYIIDYIHITLFKITVLTYPCSICIQ